MRATHAYFLSVQKVNFRDARFLNQMMYRDLTFLHFKSKSTLIGTIADRPILEPTRQHTLLAWDM